MTSTRPMVSMTVGQASMYIPTSGIGLLPDVTPVHSQGHQIWKNQIR
ncbi:hypothetical protein MSKU15_3457 [Komagataeibacter diospyri]|nr:hypothetical protein MSKU15_3457 [Komagataeibacter diospyri]